VCLKSSGWGGGDREFIANDNPNKGPKAEGGSCEVEVPSGV
jgi:hypothetical protein